MLLITVVWPCGSRRVGVGLTRVRVKARGFRALRPTTMPMPRVFVLCCSRLRERIRFFIDRSAFLRTVAEKRTQMPSLRCVSSHPCGETHRKTTIRQRFFAGAGRNAPGHHAFARGGPPFEAIPVCSPSASTLRRVLCADYRATMQPCRIINDYRMMDSSMGRPRASHKMNAFGNDSIQGRVHVHQ